MSLEFRRQRIAGAGVMLSCIEAGPERGPLVILLHGFPEDGESWRPQIEALAQAGHRVLAPDQRGYGDSDKPRGVAAYRLDVLARDVVALADQLGRERFDLVGHDWGGLVAWWTAAAYPERVRRLAILNAPHPGVARRYLDAHPSQRRRSAYVGFFQTPMLPEFLLGRGDSRLLVEVLRRTSRPGAFSEADLERYRRAWAEPRTLTAMLNWYRALRPGRLPPVPREVRAPTLVIWGAEDAFLERGLGEASLGLCEQGRAVWLEHATHWVHHEEAEAVNRDLVAFLA